MNNPTRQHHSSTIFAKVTIPFLQFYFILHEPPIDHRRHGISPEEDDTLPGGQGHRGCGSENLEDGHTCCKSKGFSNGNIHPCHGHHEENAGR
jgi:hypothetical protein